jgi:hypothetical protein
MQTLHLNPLPQDNSEESRSCRRLRGDGFLDEDVVSGLIARGVYEPACVRPDGMALSSCEDDYAGWALPIQSPFRGMRDDARAAVSAPLKTAAPPAPPSPEEGIESPYVGGHRWWLCGVSGAMACGLLALTLLSLADRVEIKDEEAGYGPVQIGVVASPATITEPALTKREPDLP